MISGHKFIKQSRKYGISEDAAGAFYDGFEKMLKVLKKYHFQWRKISDQDWQALLDIEENSQWPVLKKLLEYFYEILHDADKEEKSNVILFRNSIQDEIILRKNQYITRSEYDSARKVAIEQRFDHLLTIFEVDKANFWKTAAKIALASGVVIGTTTYIYKKYKNNKKEENSKK